MSGPGQTRCNYDPQELAIAIARGDKTYSQIGEEFGLSKNQVWGIANGRSRPEIQEQIKVVSRGFLDQARRLGARWARVLLTKHINVGLTNNGEIGRKCREYVLNQFLGDPSKPQVNVSQNQVFRAQGILSLPAEKRAELSRLLEGPRE